MVVLRLYACRRMCAGGFIEGAGLRFLCYSRAVY